MKQRKNITIDLGSPTCWQKEFVTATSKYVAYGGCRGGGKSWALRTAAIVFAINHPGSKILVVGKNYRKMRDRIIDPIRGLLPVNICTFNAAMGELTFHNTSRIRFSSANAERFRGAEFDAVFLYGAENFAEHEFRDITLRVIGANDIPKRVYLTWDYSCDPNADWIKRLFVDRKFKTGENPDDYLFINPLPADIAEERGG